MLIAKCFYRVESRSIILEKMKTKTFLMKINHELNGQSYADIGSILNQTLFNHKSLFFGTPSRKFNEELQHNIVKDVSASIVNGIYDYAIIYQSYDDLLDEKLSFVRINQDLILISLDSHHLLLLQSILTKI